MSETSEDSPEGLRLQAFMARAGLASRRACEQIILDRRVSINGNLISELGVRVKAGDVVRVDGKQIQPQDRKRYILLNKPAGYICSMQDPEGRALAADLLKGVQERVYNVGRLDQWSCGAILFTNDGELAQRLSHPSSELPKEYEVVTDQPLGEDFYREFKHGVEIEGQRYKALEVQSLGACKAKIVLIEGKNREIRRVLEHYGRKALLLRRIRIGPIQLGDLQEGCFRNLEEEELKALNQYGRIQE